MLRHQVLPYNERRRVFKPGPVGYWAVGPFNSYLRAQKSLLLGTMAFECHNMGAFSHIEGLARVLSQDEAAVYLVDQSLYRVLQSASSRG